MARFLDANSAPVHSVVNPLLVWPLHFVISAHNTENQFDLIFVLSHYMQTSIII